MAGTATVTGKIGPERTITAMVHNNVRFFSIDTDNEVLELVYNNGSGERRQQIDVSAATTITCTVSGNTYTLTIS